MQFTSPRYTVTSPSGHLVSRDRLSFLLANLATDYGKLQPRGTSLTTVRANSSFRASIPAPSDSPKISIFRITVLHKRVLVAVTTTKSQQKRRGKNSAPGAPEKHSRQIVYDRHEATAVANRRNTEETVDY